MGLVVDEGCGTLDGCQMPEELGHRIVVGRELEGRTGQVELAHGTKASFGG